MVKSLTANDAKSCVRKKIKNVLTRMFYSSRKQVCPKPPTRDRKSDNGARLLKLFPDMEVTHDRREQSTGRI